MSGVSPCNLTKHVTEASPRVSLDRLHPHVLVLPARRHVGGAPCRIVRAKAPRLRLFELTSAGPILDLGAMCDVTNPPPLSSASWKHPGACSGWSWKRMHDRGREHWLVSAALVALSPLAAAWLALTGAVSAVVAAALAVTFLAVPFFLYALSPRSVMSRRERAMEANCRPKPPRKPGLEVHPKIDRRGRPWLDVTKPRPLRTTSRSFKSVPSGGYPLAWGYDNATKPGHDGHRRNAGHGAAVESLVASWPEDGDVLRLRVLSRNESAP